MSTPSAWCPCGKWPLPMMSSAIMMPKGERVPKDLLGAEFVVSMICPVCGVQLQQRKSISGDGVLMAPGTADALLQQMAAAHKGTPS